MIYLLERLKFHKSQIGLKWIDTRRPKVFVAKFCAFWRSSSADSSFKRRWAWRPVWLGTLGYVSFYNLVAIIDGKLLVERLSTKCWCHDSSHILLQGSLIITKASSSSN